jgi:hypothetical protein
MNLEVNICPDPIRITTNEGNPLTSDISIDAMVQHKTLPNGTFICTCFDDVQQWADKNLNRIWKNDGPHWYCLHIGKPDGELFYWEMPHGIYTLENRLWIPIQMHETWYYNT